MKVINISEIEVKDRIRRYFDEKQIQRLADSISTKGLMHPIVLRGNRLVAGERRLRAVSAINELGLGILCDNQRIPPGEIAYVSISELTDCELYEAELEENVVRTDLTWQERATADAALHELRKRQNPDHTIEESREEIGRQATAFSEELVLVKHLGDPEISSAPTRKEAMKRLEKKAMREHRTRLAEEYVQAPSRNTLLFGDMKDHLKQMAKASVDVVITDPPYGIGAEGFGSMATTAHEYEDSLSSFHDLMSILAAESTRICKEKAHLYIFCDIRRFPFIEALFVSHGWQVFRTPLIWAKGNGMLPLPDYGPRRTYEAILYAYRGGKRVIVTGAPDVLSISPVQDKEHGAQKPVELYVDLLRRSTNPQDTILDPFCGSGTIFPAANVLQLRAIGIEKDKDHYNLALTRMEEE